MCVTFMPRDRLLTRFSVLYLQILCCTHYNLKVDVYSFGLTLLEVILGDCTYVKRYFRGGRLTAISEKNGGSGWRPPIPELLAESQPELVALHKECVLGDFNQRPDFCEILKRLDQCRDKAESFFNLPLHGALLAETIGYATDLRTDDMFGTVVSPTKAPFLFRDGSDSPPSEVLLDVRAIAENDLKEGEAEGVHVDLEVVVQTAQDLERKKKEL